MASRTYIPSLKIILRTFLRYTSRWIEQLQDSLDAAQFTCLQSAITAAQDCLELLPDEVPTE